MSKQALKEAEIEQHVQAKRSFLPITILLAMVCAGHSGPLTCFFPHLYSSQHPSIITSLTQLH